jgi:hypothetical protein
MRRRFRVRSHDPDERPGAVTPYFPPQGALRLTLYQTPRSESAPDVTAAFKQKALYSRTLVEHRSSGSFTYEFPGRQETFFFVRIEVPGTSGCAGWQYGAPTN